MQRAVPRQVELPFSFLGCASRPFLSSPSGEGDHPQDGGGDWPHTPRFAESPLRQPPLASATSPTRGGRLLLAAGNTNRVKCSSPARPTPRPHPLTSAPQGSPIRALEPCSPITW
ncbi:MAG: hypothetical protein CVT85_12545 [Alphaproteobacteria bacterium HGW-Alphaproteobacteria-7]|nr:MAG: hypothetical protein CVT85_12545 [Alphaproteobacteria bacterium HGW-Alphaproteobacteria-7]